MKNIYYVVLGVILVALDQATKFFLVGVNLDLGFLALTYVENTGISFGLFQGSTLIISVISIIVLGLLYLYRKEFKGREIFLVMIVSGIIGNLIDRVVLGYVRDFINLKWWPVFNVADSLMFIGVAGLLISYFTREKKINTRKLPK